MGILKNIQFLRLWGNQVLLQVAFNMSNFTALLILADRTHSPFVQAQFYTALTIPAIIFGLIAGPIVDITNRKRLILITDALLAFLFFLYIFSANDIFFILLLAFLTSSVARFFIPAEAATIPLVVERRILNHANSFFLFTLLGSVLLGYSMAGPIMETFGGLKTQGEIAPFLLAVPFLLLGFILMSGFKDIKIKKPKVPEGHIFRKTFHLFGETVDEVRVNKKISLPLILLVFIELMIGLLSVMFLEYVRRYLLFPLTSITYVLMGPLILGLVIGVVVLGRVESDLGRRKSIFLSLIATGAILILIGASPIFFGTFITRIVAVICAFFIGILIVMIAVQARTILQTNAKEQMHGRIFSFLDVLIAIAIPVPVLITGFLADRVSLLAALIFVGGIVVILTYLGNKFLLTK